MRPRLFAALLLALTSTAMAEPATPGDLQIHGFGTLGLTRSTNREAGFVRDLSQPHGSRGEWRSDTDSLLGLQASWQLSPRMALIAQGVSRYHFGNSHDPQLMSAFLRYEPDGPASLRLGRMPTDFYMYADSRHVGYSLLTVRPSTDFFGLLPFSHLDGADLQLSQPVGDSLLRGRLYWGALNEQLPLASRRWRLEGSRLLGGNLGVQHGPWPIRLSSSVLRFGQDLPIPDVSNGLRQMAALFPAAGEAAARLAVAGSRSHFHSLGLVYDEGPLQFQAMLSRAEHASAAFQNWEAGYLLLGYRRHQFTPFVGYSWIRSQARTLTSGLPEGLSPALDRIQAGFSEVLADSGSDQNTTTLGVRWEIASQMALKFQLDRIRGKSRSLFPYRDETSRWNGRTDVFSIALDFIF